jgi:phosphonate transport system permease protein
MAELSGSAPAGGREAADLSRVRADYLALTRRRRLYSGLLLLLFVVLFVGGFRIVEARNAGGLAAGFPQILDYPGGMLAEAWAKRDQLPGHLAAHLGALLETLNIALVSTLLGTILGAVLSLFATRGLALWPRLIPLFRRLSDVFRAVPEIVIALVLIFILGGGPVPAVIAIAIHTAGAQGKLFSEVNENADLKPVEGLASVGANWTQRMWLGLFPQVLPNYLSYALLRLEVNVRASAILGFVGAGGIGYDLRNAITWGPGRFDEAASVFLLLFATIVVVDQVSSLLRNRLTAGGPA